MQPQPSAIIDVILSAEGSSQAIRGLFRCFKTSNPKFSLEMLCRKVGITSRGYLSDIINEKRILNEKYANAMAEAFKLSNPATHYFKLLVELDHTTLPEQRIKLEGERQKLRKVLEVNTDRSMRAMQDRFFALEVFAAFGLFKNVPKLDDLVQFFGQNRRLEVEKSLGYLEELAIVCNAGNHYKIEESFVIFSSNEDRLSHQTFLKLSLQHASENIDHWYGAPSESLFTSTIVSVKKEEYRAFLKSFRESILQFQTNLESSDADSIVRFNVQIYPSEKV